MNFQTSLFLFQSVHGVGLAVWLSLAVANNLQAFRGSAAAVGITMAMAPLKEVPPVSTPLLARALESASVHRAALTLVLLLQAAAALSGWAGVVQLVFRGDLAAAQPWFNLALSVFAAFLFCMHLGGLWFAYWIRQEGLQLTHLGLLLWTLAAFFLFNLPWGVAGG